MLTSAVRLLFKRTNPRPLRSLGSTITASSTDPAGESLSEPALRSHWPASRLALTNQLWGTGFIAPGGETEILRLVRPLGMSAAASLLLVGAGNGGPASAIMRNFGTWVTALEADPSLLAAARGFTTRARLGKKVRNDAWDPDQPQFVARGHHHALALEPLRDARPEPILDGLARALKPGGQLVLTELAADVPLNPTDPTVRRWAALEHRDPAAILAPIAITRMLGRVGLDVRISEDMSQRHLEYAMLGWRVMLRELDRKPSPQEAAHLVAEAELWLMRRRLIKDGKLRMMRWHAISRPAVT